jgi:hypothetical protein
MKGLLYSKQLSRRSLHLNQMWNVYIIPSYDAKETLPFAATSDAYFTLSKLFAQRIAPDMPCLPIAIYCVQRWCVHFPT